MRPISMLIALFVLSTSVYAQTVTTELPQGLVAEIGFSAGRGFEQLVVFQTTQGEDATVSAGGGVGIQGGLAYFTPVGLQIAGVIGYSYTQLSPVLENADAGFRRLIVTPEIRYPIMIKPGHFIAIGAGYGLYALGRLKIDAQELIGLQTEDYYLPTTGFHMIAEYQGPISTKGAAAFGLKYYTAQYQSDYTLVNGVNVGNLGDNMNGSAIELYLRVSIGPWLDEE